MAQSFDGFPAATFAWFSGLEADNSRAWFQAHRATYEDAVRGPLHALLDELADELGGSVKLFRQHRDVRFSPDKSPYKTTAYGLIVGGFGGLSGLYAQLSSAGFFAGSGYHVLATDQLARFRDAVAGAASGAALERALEDARAGGLEVFGEALKRGPRGYPRDHPRAQLLRHKALAAGRRLDAGAGGIPRATALCHARATWTALAAMNAWLDEHVGASELPPPARYGRGR